MKVRILSLVVLVLLLLAVTPALSQVQETTWTANIPFNFIVAGDQMPAGHYVIKHNPLTMRLTVVNKETKQKAGMFTRDVEKLNPNEKTVLVFQRSGDQHVLHQVWAKGESHGHDIMHGEDIIELMKVK